MMSLLGTQRGRTSQWCKCLMVTKFVTKFYVIIFILVFINCHTLPHNNETYTVIDGIIYVSIPNSVVVIHYMFGQHMDFWHFSSKGSGGSAQLF